MSDDRELDALITEKVFGNRFGPETMRFSYTLCEYEATGKMENREGTISDFCRKCGKPYGYHDGYPRFSTEPAASKQLRDKLAERYEWLLSRMDGPAPYLFTLFKKSEHGNGAEIASAAGSTEELVVALCALKSVGIEANK